MILFAAILGGLLGGACFFVPDATARKTMLGVQVEKLRRLQELPGERVIIVGGSGCGQGFVTSNLCAALNRPVYNMGLHAGLGLIYQMKAVEPLVRRGDVVLLVPEYANFDGTTCFGAAELLMMVIDIIPEHKTLLPFRHWLHLLPMVPKYGADKLRHLFMPSRSGDLLDDFDSYGDKKCASDLSPLAQVPFPAANVMSAKDFSPVVVKDMKDFAKVVQSKGGRVYVFPPAYQRTSFNHQRDYIERITAALRDSKIPFVVAPDRYALDDKYFYDTPYHLNLVGRKVRSDFFAKDLNGILSE